MTNIILLVLGGVIVVCCLGLGILFWKKRREDLRQQEKEKIFQEKYGVEPPEFGTLTWIDQKVYPFSYDLNLRYEEKESGLYIWKPSVLRIGRFLLTFSNPYRAIEYIQYLHNEGVPLVKKGEQTYSVPTLEELKNVLPDKVFSSFHKN